MNLEWKAAIVVVTAAVSAASASAQKPRPNPLVDALTACRSERVSEARLECFDRATAALQAATSSGALVIVEKADVQQTRRSLFGFSLPKLPFFSGDDSADEQPDEITAKVASARSIGYGKYRVTLEDGAIWETTEGSSFAQDPRAGDKIVIKKGTLGSYKVRIAGQRALRARRIG